METIRLINGVEMPLVGLGTWGLRGEECVKSVCSALKMGYPLIDTAEMYGNESEVGRGIAESGIRREAIFLTTKVYRSSGTYEKAKASIDRSLKAFGTDYVDLLLLHEPYPKAEEIYRAIEEAYQAGKARAIGISNYDAERCKDFLDKCMIKPMVDQVEVHAMFQRWDLQDQLMREDIAMQAWAPLGSGECDVPVNRSLAAIGAKYGKTAAQVALRFLVQRGIGVIPKSSHLERLKENLEIFDFVLSEEDVSEICHLDTKETFFPWTKAY